MADQILTTTTAAGQYFQLDTVQGGPIDIFVEANGGGRGGGVTVTPFTVAIPEASDAGAIVFADGNVPSLVGAAWSGLGVVWPRDTGPVSVHLLDVHADPETGDVQVAFIASAFFPGASGQGLLLLVYP